MLACKASQHQTLQIEVLLKLDFKQILWDWDQVLNGS